jgi:pSer/pThr/pTyr-binding forkhead associated (FHA) protein
MSSTGTLQALVVTQPQQVRGETFSIDRDELTIGRAEGNDVRLEDPYVSRRHAIIRREHGTLHIEDLGSSAGLIVNGVPTAEPALLRLGDRIRLGDVELELVGAVDEPSGEQTRARPPSAMSAAPLATGAPEAVLTAPRSERAPASVIPAAPLPPPAQQPRVTFGVGNQRGETISNVAGNQVNGSYTENRYGAEELRLAPMRRRARWVMRMGFALILVGLAVGLAGAAIWDHGILSCADSLSAGPANCVKPVGFYMVGAGGAAVIFGIIFVIMSLFMWREVRRQEARR